MTRIFLVKGTVFISKQRCPQLRSGFVPLSLCICMKCPSFSSSLGACVKVQDSAVRIFLSFEHETLSFSPKVAKLQSHVFSCGYSAKESISAVGGLSFPERNIIPKRSAVTSPLVRFTSLVATTITMDFFREQRNLRELLDREVCNSCCGIGIPTIICHFFHQGTVFVSTSSVILMW